MHQRSLTRRAVALLLAAGLVAGWAGTADAGPADEPTTTTTTSTSATVALPTTTSTPTPVDVEDMSRPRLERLAAYMAGVVDQGQLPGVVTLVARHGQVVHLEAQGSDGKGGQLHPDALFRMYSMTKVMTSVAVMTLVDEGRLELGNPVSAYLPAFADVQVQEGGALVAPARPITIRDLLDHTSGTIGLTEALTPPSPLVLDATSPISTIVDQIAALSLRAQPGARFEYGFGQEIAGVIVEKVTGQTLEEVFQDRIFGPLGMTDSSFYVPADKADRLVPELIPTPAVAPDEGFTWSPVPGPTPYSSDKIDPLGHQFGGGGWGGGVVTTISDYARFAQMLLDGGQLDGARVLSRKSVELLSASHTGTLPTLAGPGYGFGLGVGVRTDLVAHPVPGSVGRYGWSGAAFTYFFIDPSEDLVAIRLANVFGVEAVPGLATLNDRFDALVYAAVE